MRLKQAKNFFNLFQFIKAFYFVSCSQTVITSTFLHPLVSLHMTSHDHDEQQ